MKVGDRDMRAVWWDGSEEDGAVVMVDQRLLPHRLVEVCARGVAEVAAHIRDMTVRGAPTIGATAAYGMVLGRDDPTAAAALLGAARPTARDLFTALEWMQSDGGPTLARAERYVDDVVDRCRRIGMHGAALLGRLAGARAEGGAGKGPLTLLTHCHAGAFAAVDHGTALAPIHAYAATAPTGAFVWVDETRPRLQGAITAWELQQAGVPHRVIVEGASGALFQRGAIDAVIVGADRIAWNGDVANKVGTYTKAVLAKEHGVPFYVAAPATTFDPALPDGNGIVIEERDAEEVLRLGGTALFGAGTQAANPAFDVTPASFVSGYITEQGVLDVGGLQRMAAASPGPLVR